MEREKELKNINIEEIIPNRFQPRLSFDPEALGELSESIKQYGVFQPLVVRRIGNKYEIIAGERRYKASTQAGYKEVPCIVIDLDDNESAEIALVENLQRKDLTPIEEAKSYKKLLDRGYITQDQLAKKMGKSQSAISNKLRLLNLDEEVQEALLDTKISERHARSLLSLKDRETQKQLLNKIIEKRMTVRETDLEVKQMINEENRKPDFIPFNNQTPSSEINQPSIININPEKITEDELNAVDPLNIEEKPKAVLPEIEPEIEEVNAIDIDKLTKSAQDLNKQGPRPNIMDLLRVEKDVNYNAAPIETTFTPPTIEQDISETAPVFSQPLPDEPIINESVDQIPTAMENPIPEINPQNLTPIEPVFSTPTEMFIPNEVIPPTVESQYAGTPIIGQIGEQPVSFESPEQPIPEVVPLTFPTTENSFPEQPMTYENQPAEQPVYQPMDIPIMGQTVEQPFVYENPQQPIPEEPVAAPEPVQQTVNPNVANNIRTAITTVRECVSTIEKFGVNIDKEELDLQDSYQITITIAKTDA